MTIKIITNTAMDSYQLTCITCKSVFQYQIADLYNKHAMACPVCKQLNDHLPEENKTCPAQESQIPDIAAAIKRAEHFEYNMYKGYTYLDQPDYRYFVALLQEIRRLCGITSQQE